MQEGTIQDILAFRMHDFPASISPSARAFVLAALTHSAELRPTPEQLLSHPWVTGYVKGVTNVLSDDRRVSAEQLAADVVRVTGSSETAVSMLRSIGSLQVRFVWISLSPFFQISRLFPDPCPAGLARLPRARRAASRC